jgi:hypothetical protein
MKMKCADHSRIDLRVVDKPIIYQDKEEGKIIGEGYLKLDFGGDNFFTLNFSYELLVKDNKYKYIFNKFFYRKYAAGQTSKVPVANVYFSSTVRSSDNTTKDFPLETILEKNYLRNDFKKNEGEFHVGVMKMIERLEKAMSETTNEIW